MDDDSDPFDRLARTGSGDVPPIDAFDEVVSGPPPDPGDTTAIWAAIQSEPADSRPDHEAVVKTANYCERCPYLADPPTLQCTHPGASLVDFPDRDHVRVRGCPFAANNQSPTRARGRSTDD